MDKIKVKSGFTMLELLIVIAVFLSISFLAVPFQLDWINQAEVDAAQAEIAQALSQARLRSLSGLNDAAHGVYLDTNNNSYTLYQGPDYQARITMYDYVRNFSSEPELSADLSDINFSTTNGFPSATGTVVISDGMRSANININELGLVYAN